MKKQDEITSELIQRCTKDDRKAIKTLYEVSFSFLMPVCMRYHTNEEDARASYNIAFMKILTSLKNAPENLIYVSWAKRITINTLIDEYRKQKNYNSKIQSKETERELEVTGYYNENDGANEIGYELILKLVAELPAVTSKVFNLYVIEGYSHKEIGELLEMTEGTSKWHLSTGRKALREKIELLEKDKQYQKMAL